MEEQFPLDAILGYDGHSANSAGRHVSLDGERNGFQAEIDTFFFAHFFLVERIHEAENVLTPRAGHGDPLLDQTTSQGYSVDLTALLVIPTSAENPSSHIITIFVADVAEHVGGCLNRGRLTSLHLVEVEMIRNRIGDALEVIMEHLLLDHCCRLVADSIHEMFPDPLKLDSTRVPASIIFGIEIEEWVTCVSAAEPDLQQ